VSKHVKHVPKHRGAPNPVVPTEAPKKAIRTTLVFSSVAVAATGAAVSAGLFSTSPAGVSAASADLGSTTRDEADAATAAGAEKAAASAEAEVEVEDRAPVVSRSSDRRAETDPAKAAALEPSTGGAMTVTETLSDDDPRDIARALLGEYGFSADQFGCLDSLWTKESGWSVTADNPTSSAYGIPQALTATHDLAPDYMTNPVTQIRWGLDYIRDRYGSPCGAWGHSQSTGWY
jgi:hypothetical protein